MSVGGQFKRIGEIGIALGLWGIVIWLFSKPKRILFFLLIVFITAFSISLIFDDTGETFYVNTNTLELCDKPFGTTKIKLKMNDSLTLIREMSDDWMQVAVGVDTLYFKENFYNDSELGYTYKIQKTPFTKWKALPGQKVLLNHPDGYLEAGGSMIKNGDVITILDYSEYDKEIKFKNTGGTFTKIPIEYLKINWEKILKNYPNIQ
ncbi:hypothetical protein [Saccharicrinis fermentans]|uniref:Uncharacterized protein n=1 Tax=Saccharicrinis fermentans DSM 9555 = JCM 21142 TaxID=869213 RepID=W7YEQ7_9BACT|nr:hypothetical protein [Saccharicrinis fermentans]GAF05958.1 hypothetical protein JCM21142_134723 [Saccharicrinis fermentans DSM 9555 = JCM 21142]